MRSPLSVLIFLIIFQAVFADQIINEEISGEAVIIDNVHENRPSDTIKGSSENENNNVNDINNSPLSNPEANEDCQSETENEKKNIDSQNPFNTSVNQGSLDIKISKNLSLKEFLVTLLPARLIDDESKSNSEMSTKESNNSETVSQLYANQTSNGTTITNSKKSFCTNLPFNETVFGDVQIVNASTLQKLLVSNLNVTSRSTAARCNLVYFFSNYCPFSAQGSAYVNALARSLINIPIYGLNSIEDHSVNTRYGVMGTPSLVLFHNGNVVARYNASDYSTFFLESFVHHFTDQVIYSINVTSHDFKANLPSKVSLSTPYALYCAWLFLVMCGCCFFLNSQFYAKLKEAVLNNWREADEAQHAHED